MASGELTPVVMLPRYTTFAGANEEDKEFVTLAMDVTAYQSAIISVWHGKLVGSTPTMLFALQESSDGVNWSPCTGGGQVDPGQDTELAITVPLIKQWFRIQVKLTGTGPVGTCYAVGYFERRLS